MLTNDPAAVISVVGVKGKDRLCVETPNIFVESMVLN